MSGAGGTNDLGTVLDRTIGALDRMLETFRPRPGVYAYGTLAHVGPGIARAEGLAGARSDELIRFPGSVLGMAFNIDETETGIVLLDRNDSLQAGMEVRCTGRVVDVPVGDAVIGRVLDPLGRPLDGREPVRSSRRYPIERAAPAIMDRLPVTVPLQTGLKVVDALIPIGRGQRELIVGDRQTGKTAIALDTIINQRGTGVVCLYCAIGKQNSAVAKFIADLRDRGAMEYCTVVIASEDEPAGIQFAAAYAATSMAEYFMEQGRDVLIVYDDLTRHARAYRELSLLLNRPPGREAFPGDIFYIHSRLLERATHLKDELGGGSLTALPIIETEAQNISAYIPTNLISITDGQIYLSPDLFQKGILPAVDVGRSVSRVGGKTQLSAYRAVAGDLRLSYSQFEELESFARFGTKLDKQTRRTIERGRRVREILKQPQYAPLPVEEQILCLAAVTGGAWDDVPPERIASLEQRMRSDAREQIGQIGEKIRNGKKLDDRDLAAVNDRARAVAEEQGKDDHAGDRSGQKKDRDD